MKVMIASMGVLIASLFATAADAACTQNAHRLGWDAAVQACSDIAQGWVPMPRRRFVSSGVPDPERTCTPEQVIRCKNAMAQYLRQAPGCSSLIRRNVPLSASVGSGGTARQVWTNYVNTTCNM